MSKKRQAEYLLKLLLPSVVILLSGSGCKEESPVEQTAPSFVISSPVISADSLLPKKYTCDGESLSLPLEWSGSPDNTKCFALIMHHEASPTDIHWYWILYNIPPDVHSLAENITGIGIPGNNSVNGRTEYAPPCSQGPGPKKYVISLYALSDTVSFSIPNSEVNREVLLKAIENITLSAAALTVVYSRG